MRPPLERSKQGRSAGEEGIAPVELSASAKWTKKSASVWGGPTWMNSMVGPLQWSVGPSSQVTTGRASAMRPDRSWATMNAPARPILSLPPARSPCQWVFIGRRIGSEELRDRGAASIHEWRERVVDRDDADHDSSRSDTHSVPIPVPLDHASSENVAPGCDIVPCLGEDAREAMTSNADTTDGTGSADDGEAPDYTRDYTRDLGVIEAITFVTRSCPSGVVVSVAEQALEAIKQQGADAIPQQAYFVLTSMQGWRGDRARQVHRSLTKYLEERESSSQ